MTKLLQDELIAVIAPVVEEKIIAIHLITNASIYQTWSIQLANGLKLFAKTSGLESFPRLKYEADCLNALNKFTDKSLLELPKVFYIKKLASIAILLTSWLSLNHGNQTLLGKGVASLHKLSSKESRNQFGWDSNGFIGLGIQPGGWDNNWAKCFVELRLIPQFKIAKKWNINMVEVDQLISLLIPFLQKHNPLPVIVHGDLWSGNVASNENGKGVIFDPASWWADREVDIAMTKLFGGFSQDFYVAYEKVWPLPKDSNTRTDIYNLYHLVNHANIFGGSYIEQTLSCMRRIKLKLNNLELN